MENHLLFYDGNCGLCHAWVNFVLHFDKASKFKFSPLQGETIKKVLDSDLIESLPDSIVVKSATGGVYMKARAVEFILEEIGLPWSIFGKFIEILPENFKNGCYDVVARYRIKIFGKKDDLCPIIPKEIQNRFLM